MNFTDHMSQNDTPLVFKNAIRSWPASKWNLEILATILGNKILKCKIGQRAEEGSVFETDCFYQDVCVRDFVEWCEGRNCSENPLSHLDKFKYFCYIDYKYMSEIFIENTELLKTIDWGDFGLTNRDGKDSTLWIGSEGAFTPCHYDTYGFNLVAQIYGRKRWTLFPPTDSCNLYPTRIPYEESSVFSDVNIKQPNLDKHPGFLKCTPYMITLNPGEVLYVPKRWWHYVESVEPSISINTWVEIEDDRETRVQEAISRLLFTSLHSNLLDCFNTSEWVNPNEELKNTSINLAYLKKATNDLTDTSTRDKVVSLSTNFKLFCEKFKSHNVLTYSDLILHKEDDLLCSDNSETENSAYNSKTKKRKMSLSYREDLNVTEDVVIFVVPRSDVAVFLKSTRKFTKYSTDIDDVHAFTSASSSETFQNDEKLSKHFVQSLLHPDIIDLITHKYLKSK